MPSLPAFDLTTGSGNRPTDASERSETTKGDEVSKLHSRNKSDAKSDLSIDCCVSPGGYRAAAGIVTHITRGSCVATTNSEPSGE
jgi:hypothetical protein